MSDTEQIQQIIQSYITAIHTQDKDSFLSLWTGNKADTLISLTSVFQAIPLSNYLPIISTSTR